MNDSRRVRARTHTAYSTGFFLCVAQLAKRQSARGMTLYSSCGFLGFGATEATDADFQRSGYEPQSLYASCGFLGFGSKRADLSQIPESWRDDCNPARAERGATYSVEQPGECSLSGCAPGQVKAGGRCVAPGTPCTPAGAPPSNASYAYESNGKCSFRACGAGSVERPATEVTQAGLAGKCPFGYVRMSDESACRAAAMRYKLPFAGKVSEPGMAAGCVVHTVAKASGGKAGGVVSFNIDTSGVAFTDNQFGICARDDAASSPPCVTVGAKCAGMPSNYTYNAKGYCQGKCGALMQTCQTGERCCSGFKGGGVCLPEGTACPQEKKWVDEAASLGAQIHAIAGSFKSMSSALSQIHKI